MSWYEGPTLLEHLETVPLPDSDSFGGLAVPHPERYSPDANFRGFSGRIASGVVRPVIPLWRCLRTKNARALDRDVDGDLSRAYSPMSVTLRLRGDRPQPWRYAGVRLMYPTSLGIFTHGCVAPCESAGIGAHLSIKHTFARRKSEPQGIRQSRQHKYTDAEQATQLRMQRNWFG